MSIDHFSFNSNDYHKTVSFYEAVLATLGNKKIITIEGDKAVGFGQRFPTFWIGNRGDSNEEKCHVGIHIGFAAKTRRQVDDFYQTALKHGAKDNGPPGFRPLYHRFYYAAFVIDPHGNNIEAVNHFDWRAFGGCRTIILTCSILCIGIGLLIKKFF
ncbi:unnamed protein product [Adineta steineri]|uniref:VOC domain-containing protein n=1 Tax=Adineta steineri TaxID=433720 RepID=A0A814Z7I5_9BILA|nr:unnamed protein product [Adineta steineri]CAF1505835.1 unnamed protein product [Adineta steineri]CAF1535851.1 unnamed protein product [Adineta steineri]CAF1655484.1 unnamed protein product [Adineta steineri]